jgi:LysM repeat protein
MSVADKYASVIALAHELGCSNVTSQEENGHLTVSGSCPNQYALNQVWDRLKQVDANFADISVNITPQRNDIYGEYEVKSGDTLSKIAKEVTHGKLTYNQIFEANRDQLDDPDQINVGQRLVIPNF